VAQRTGIEVRHKKLCASRGGARCNCQATYQASVWSARESTRIRKTFATLADARAWRSETQTGVRRGILRAPAQTTVRDAAESEATALVDAYLTRSRRVTLEHR
jgi:signal transduction protein with GAF and PtsI domain